MKTTSGWTFKSAAVLTVFAMLLVASPSWAAVTNGSFEQGLTGWVSQGTPGQIVSSYGSLTPTDGSAMLKLTAVGYEEEAGPPGMPPMPMPGHVGAYQTLSLNPGDRLSFDYYLPMMMGNAVCYFGTWSGGRSFEVYPGMTGEAWSRTTKVVNFGGTAALTFVVDTMPEVGAQQILLLDNIQIERAGLQEELPFLPPPATPLPPGQEPPAGPQPWIFPNVPGTGAWFDPPMVSAFNYQATAGLFTEVGVPLNLPDSDGKYLLQYGAQSIELVPGQHYQFPSPVGSFTISGIDPTVDAADAEGFPTYLKFDQPSASFTMTPVPEPSVIVLLGIGGISLLAWVWRRRRAR